MTDHGARVALLAREGEARERLRDALREAGAEVVAVADPLTASINDVTSAAPRAVLVALEPEIEDALDGWGALLSDPAIAVIFDEAELAARRSGWDAARWVRHLRAKLNNHDDVLPPGTEPEDEWGLLPGPLQEQVPAGPDRHPADWDGGPDASSGLAAAGFAPEDGDVGEDQGGSPDLQSPAPGGAPEEEGLAADEGLEAWLARMSAAAPEEEVGAALQAPAEAGASVPPEQQAPPAFDINGLSLADDRQPLAGAAPAGPQAPSLEALEARISGLSLADVDSYGHGPERGAVLVEAGLGGPDAVRQLLAALETGFPRPLLVRLRLDGGRYDRLVRQMDRATPLTVALAEEDATIEPGHVYFLPPEFGVARDKGRLHFVRDAAASGRLPDALPADDSAVLFLSGGDPALVDDAMSRAGAGALVIGQATEDNFDPAATVRLLERGGRASTPAEIAAELLERWPPPDRPAGADLEDPEP